MSDLLCFKNKKQGFTLIEVVLASTLLTLVVTPLLLSLTNLGFQYRNLKNNYYAQIIAQGHLEDRINVFQGSNPTGALIDYDNHFCDRIIIPGTCASGLPLMSSITQNTFLSVLNLPVAGDPRFTATISNNSIPIADSRDGIDYTTTTILSPVCRDLSDNLTTKNADGSCDPAISTQDFSSMEIISNVSWDPPGPVTTANYRISTILTEFEDL